MPVKTLALTFDDGPSADIMPRVLDLLECYGARATFFIWGEKITPELETLLKRCTVQGCELGNHSMHHLHMSQLDEDQIRAEVEPLQERLLELTGIRPVLFRAPYLDISPLMKQVISLPIINGVSSKDWTPATSTQERIRLVQEGAEDRAIILMHCFAGNTATVEALEELLPWFAQRGIRATTVTDLFRQKAVEAVAGRVYDSAV